MLDYKVLFLDIDGTIIRPDKSIEPSTKASIAAAMQKGIEVILTTGRPIHEIEGLAQDLNVNSFIGYNGASAILNGKEIFKLPIHPEHVEKLLTLASIHHHEVVLHTNKVNYLSHLESIKTQQFINLFEYKRNVPFHPEYIKSKEILGGAVINARMVEASLYEEIGSIYLSQTNSEGMHHCFDIMRSNVNKGTGVNKVLNQLGILREQAIAFGDGLNDKEMLMNVEESFAMGNSHPDLFSYAKYKTTDVLHSGLYNGLKMIGIVD
ncbi:MAG: HAD family hydrolase [Bacillota bacterium]|nr:HAD family hydrolase [Bacillota bacterium]